MSDKLKKNLNSKTSVDHSFPSALNEVLLYELDAENFRMEVQTDGDTVWLTQQQMAELFEKSKSTINEHIKNIFTEGELVESNVMRKFGNSEFSTKKTS